MTDVETATTAHWSYRVVATTVRTADYTDTEYAIHECYYNPLGWTVSPVPVRSDSVDGLRTELTRMLLALDLEVLR